MVNTVSYTMDLLTHTVAIIHAHMLRLNPFITVDMKMYRKSVEFQGLVPLKLIRLYEGS